MVMCEKIRYARMREGLSRTELARKTGMDANTVRCIEEGTIEPGIDQQIRLSGALHVSVYFLRHDESKDPDQLAGAQEAMIEFCRRFGNDALLRYEEKIRRELGGNHY